MKLERGPGRGNWVCFYINLDRRADRRERLLQVLKPVPWLCRRLRRFAAVDGKELSGAQLKALEPEGVLANGATDALDAANVDLKSGAFSCHLSRGSIGCILSHRQVWAQLLEARSDGVDWALVLEDDVTALACDFEARLEGVLQLLPADFDLCYVGYHGAALDGRPLELLACDTLGPEVHGTFGYLISAGGAAKLLKGLPPQSPFPLTKQLDSALSRILGGLNAWRVAQGAALVCSPPSLVPPIDSDCQLVCHCGGCSHNGGAVRCSKPWNGEWCRKNGRWQSSSKGQQERQHDSRHAATSAGSTQPAGGSGVLSEAEFTQFLTLIGSLARGGGPEPAADAPVTGSVAAGHEVDRERGGGSEQQADGEREGGGGNEERAAAERDRLIGEPRAREAEVEELRRFLGGSGGSSDEAEAASASAPGGAVGPEGGGAAAEEAAPSSGIRHQKQPPTTPQPPPEANGTGAAEPPRVAEPAREAGQAHASAEWQGPRQASPQHALPQPPRQTQLMRVMQEAKRIVAAATPAEVLNIAADADQAAMHKAWKQLMLLLHPDKLLECTPEERGTAAAALHSVHQAKDDFRESSQASGAVDVPDEPQSSTRPLCTRNTPGNRRYECRWEVPDIVPRSRPIQKYEVYGPRIFAHTGEPMEWVLLASLPKLESTFVFVEESPTQQEVMWAGDRMRVPSIPLTVYAVNGRGRSEALYFHLPWSNKFTWLNGFTSMICRQCCALQPRPQVKQGDKVPCSSCGTMQAPSAAAITIRCPKCQGEALWDNAMTRLDCRLCGRHIATNPKRQPAQRQNGGGSGGPINRGQGAQSVPPSRRTGSGSEGGPRCSPHSGDRH